MVSIGNVNTLKGEGRREEGGGRKKLYISTDNGVDRKYIIHTLRKKEGGERKMEDGIIECIFFQQSKGKDDET